MPRSAIYFASQVNRCRVCHDSWPSTRFALKTKHLCKCSKRSNLSCRVMQLHRSTLHTISRSKPRGLTFHFRLKIARRIQCCLVMSCRSSFHCGPAKPRILRRKSAPERLLASLPLQLDRSKLSDQFQRALELGLEKAVWNRGYRLIQQHTAQDATIHSQTARGIARCGT